MSDIYKEFNRLDDRLHRCPECGEKAMIRVKSDCMLQDGTLVFDLERWQCAECRANFFDSKAMDEIRRTRSARRGVAVPA